MKKVTKEIMKSILQDKKICYKTKRTDNLHKHHIYGGRNRKVSEENGFYVYLIGELHNMSDRGVHFDKKFDLELKQACQRKFEETNSRERFMALIGRNYLD